MGQGLAGPLGFGASGIWSGLAAGTIATAAGAWLYLRRRDRHLPVSAAVAPASA